MDIFDMPDVVWHTDPPVIQDDHLGLPASALTLPPVLNRRPYDKES